MASYGDPMTFRWIVAVAITAALLSAPGTALGWVNNKIVVIAPKKVKVGARYTIRIAMTFDAHLSAPPGTYVMMQAWSRPGAAPCPTAAPFDRPGWTSVARYTFIPKGNASDDETKGYIRDSERIAKPGARRYCGYIYLARYREVGAIPTYETKTRGTALTRARR